MNQETSTLTIGQRFALGWMMERVLESGNGGTRNLSKCFSGMPTDEVFDIVSTVADKYADNQRARLENVFKEAIESSGSSTADIPVNFVKEIERSPEMRRVLSGSFG